jgi:hypothetical protein
MLGHLRKKLFDKLYRALGPKDMADYDGIVSNPLTSRYVSQFMHRTSILAQSQHADVGGISDNEIDELKLTERDPKDTFSTVLKDGERLTQLLEGTLPDKAAEPLIGNEARPATNGV